MNVYRFLVFFVFFMAISSCNSNTKNSTVKIDKFVLNGLFQGNQDGYYLKNKFGEDLIINGNRVPVPSVEYKFLFKENLEVSLQQTSEDGKKVYYEGNYKAVKNDEEIVLIECKLSDGEYSNPTMTIEFSKLNKTYTFKGENWSPNFNLNKIN